MTVQDTSPRSTPAGDAIVDVPNADRAALLGQIGVPLILLLLVVVFALTADDFLSGSNIKTIFSDAAFPSIVAVGLTICLVMGEFDLSLNGVAGLATIVVAVLVAREGMSTIPAILITLVGVGLMVGIVNGALVGFLGVNALIVTIATNSALLGLQYVVSGSEQIFGGFPPGFVDFARGDLGPIPNMVVVSVLIALAVWMMLVRSTLCRQMRAIGGNEEAARVAGVHTARTKVWGFALCALLAAVAGTLFAGKQTAAFPLSGLDVLLPSYAACFIGAATFKVGEFNVPGTLVGVMIATITANGLLLQGVANYATYLIQAAILLVALIFARVVARRRAQV
jgi:ribose transport system permease protein